MLFMVVEHSQDNDMVPVYQRLREGGRSLPKGLEYIDSWVEANFSRCFQLMRCDDLKLIQAWISSGAGRREIRNRPRCDQRGNEGGHRALSR